MKLSVSLKIYIGIIITFTILVAISIFLPSGDFLPVQELPVSKPVIALVNAVMAVFIYGGLGFLGLRLSKSLGFVDIWDSDISHKKRFLLPGLIGIGIGAFFILMDVLFRRFRTFGSLPHPPFPTSIVASAVAAIGEEVIFRLFFISFWVWLISIVIFKNKWKNQIFWIVVIFSGLLFALGHIPSVIAVLEFNSLHELPLGLMIEIFLLNGFLSIVTGYYFRKNGFLSAVGIHFWTDIVWHVIWGIL